MTTLTEIRQTFAHDLHRLDDPAKRAWLIKGDFDHFKMFNNIYGCVLTDYILDWSIEAIEITLQDYERRMGVGGILWNVLGDDVTIYIPPSTISESDVSLLLQSMRSAVHASFDQRYAVGKLPLPHDFFADIQPARLEELKLCLESHDILIDFAPRPGGFLTLFPLQPGKSFTALVGEITHQVQNCLGKTWLSNLLRWHWLNAPNNLGHSIFGHNWIVPPSISFAACPIGSTSISVKHLTGKFEQTAGACQVALKACKEQRCGYLLGLEANSAPDEPLELLVPDAAGAWSKLHWASERYLRERLYFQQIEQTLLFQINPVYRFASGAHTECFGVEKYRGNEHGVGLKGINELCSQRAANEVIRLLIMSFAEAFSAALEGKSTSPNDIITALFVDRFTVTCDQRAFTIPAMVALGKRLQADFNKASQEIKIAHLRISLASCQQPQPGYLLLHRLTLAQLPQCASGAVSVAYTDAEMEVRQFLERQYISIHRNQARTGSIHVRTKLVIGSLYNPISYHRHRNPDRDT